MCHYFFICIYKEELTKKSIKETKTYSVFLYIKKNSEIIPITHRAPRISRLFSEQPCIGFKDFKR